MASERRVPVDRSLVAVPRERVGRRRGRRRFFTRENATRGALLVAGAGAIVALLANLDDLKNSESAKSHWWLLPLAVLAIGYMLRKRGNPYGTAVLAVGGALFALAYQIQSAKPAQAQQQPQQQPPPNQPFAPQQFRGDVQGPFGLPGVMPQLANMLPGAGSNHLWVQMPDGQVAKMPLLAAVAAALRQRNGFNQRPAPAAAAA